LDGTEENDTGRNGTAAGPLLRVTLLGRMRAEDTTGRSLLPRSRKTRAVLAVLALAAPNPVLRSRLTALLWSGRGKDQARASLRQAVHELQCALGSQAGTLLQAERHHLTLQQDRLWIDAHTRTDGMPADKATLLDDLDGLDPAFDGWLAAERGHMVQQARPMAVSTLFKRGPADGIRVAVLPLRTLGGGAVAPLSGLAEELTAAVSRFRWLSCVVGSGGDYLLDSAMQCAGDRCRVIIRLLDTHAGNNVVWAGRFDRRMHDELSLQGEIAGETAAQIDPELLLREGGRRVTDWPQRPAASDLMLRAIAAIYRLEPSSFHAAGELLANAVAMDPCNAAAHAWWAYWHLFLVGQGWTPDPAAATSRAGELAERAVTLDPTDARAVALVGHVRAFLYKRAEEACALHEHAISLNPNLPLAWCFCGLARSYLGQHDIAIEHIHRAQRLSPHDPHAFFFDMALMMPHFLRGEFAKALACGRRAVELNPGCSSTYKGYLATLGQLGQHEEAARVLARLQALEPGFSVSSAVARSPMTRPDDLARYVEGLRLAGLRED
jgi:TolB-like protein